MENESNLGQTEETTEAIPEEAEKAPRKPKLFFKTPEEYENWWNRALKRYRQSLIDDGIVIEVGGDLIDVNSLRVSRMPRRRCDI